MNANYLDTGYYTCRREGAPETDTDDNRIAVKTYVFIQGYIPRNYSQYPYFRFTIIINIGWLIIFITYSILSSGTCNSPSSSTQLTNNNFNILDDNHLIVHPDVSEMEIIDVIQSSRAIIPCKPTHPDIEVFLTSDRVNISSFHLCMT